MKNSETINDVKFYLIIFCLLKYNLVNMLTVFLTIRYGCGFTFTREDIFKTLYYRFEKHANIDKETSTGGLK